MSWFVGLTAFAIYMIVVWVQAEQQRQRRQAELQRRLAKARGQGSETSEEPPQFPGPFQPGPVVGPRPRMETVPPPPRPQSTPAVTPSAARPAPPEPRRVRPPRRGAMPHRREREVSAALTSGPDASQTPPQLAGLTPWQQAVVWSEVFGRPRSLQPWRGQPWRDRQTGLR